MIFNRNNCMMLLMAGFFAVPCCAQHSAADKISAHIVPPHVIMEQREAIGLSEEQISRIHQHTDFAESKLHEVQLRIDSASQEMAEWVDASRIDEKATLELLDGILASEREIKRLQLQAKIRVCNELSSQQLATARQVASQNGNSGGASRATVQQRLRHKVNRIKAEFDRRVANGIPPTEAANVMRQFGQKMDSGQPAQAERILNQVLKMMDLGEATDSPQDPSGVRRELAPAALDNVVAMKPQSVGEIRRRVKSLKKEDVAWRKIGWETCLLKGLQRSKDERKPVLLWVFIDRPIDDERC